MWKWEQICLDVIFSFVFFRNSYENKKLKKASRAEENDYGEENEMFLNLIFTANKKDKLKNFAQGPLFPPPYYTILAIRGPVKDTFKNPIDSLDVVDSPLGRIHQSGYRLNSKKQGRQLCTSCKNNNYDESFVSGN